MYSPFRSDFVKSKSIDGISGDGAVGAGDSLTFGAVVQAVNRSDNTNAKATNNFFITPHFFQRYLPR